MFTGWRHHQEAIFPEKPFGISLILNSASSTHRKGWPCHDSAHHTIRGLLFKHRPFIHCQIPGVLSIRFDFHQQVSLRSWPPHVYLLCLYAFSTMFICNWLSFFQFIYAFISDLAAATLHDLTSTCSQRGLSFRIDRPSSSFNALRPSWCNTSLISPQS